MLLTDTYLTRFDPLTKYTPRCLLPLANVPLLEYTLEFLATANIDEVYLMIHTQAHDRAIKNYLESSKWHNTHLFKIHRMVSPESSSVGDALRDLDSKGLITKDFLLLSGDVVTNMSFEKVLKAHKDRKSKDKNAIATMVLKQASSIHRARSRIESGIFILNKEGRCLQYEPSSLNSSSLIIDPEILNEHDTLELRNELIDCRIDICSPLVPQLFTENFDYDDLRSDFVKGILSSDLLGKTIYTYILTDDYAARVDSQQTYDAITKDIVSRWAFPIAPDANLLPTQTYKHSRGHIYKEDGVKLSFGCHIESCTVIGEGSFIGTGSRVKNSIIGRNCNIGENVILENAYIWDDVKIGNNSKISYSIVANGVHIGTNVVVHEASIVGFNVKIDDDITIKKRTKLILEEPEEKKGDNSSSDDEYINEKRDASIVGPNGLGFEYCEKHINVFETDSTSRDSDEETTYTRDDLADTGLIYQLEDLTISDDSISTFESAPRRRKPRTLSGTSASAYSAEEDDFEDESFDKEAIASLNRAMDENHDIDVAVLEINTLRMAMNVDYDEVREATVRALLIRISHFIETGTLEIKEASQKVLRHWSILFKRQIFKETDEVHLLNLFEQYCREINHGKGILFFVIDILYDLEIVQEQNIYKWFETCDKTEVSKAVVEFVEWLQNAEEESDSE